MLTSQLGIATIALVLCGCATMNGPSANGAHDLIEHWAIAHDIPFVVADKAAVHDAVGGFEISFGGQVFSPKAIKYISFDLSVYNSVGDAELCAIRGTNGGTVKYIGPFTLGEKFWGYFDPIVYNRAATSAEVTRIVVDYMDGTTATYKGDSLAQFAPNANWWRRSTPYYHLPGYTTVD